MHNMVRSIAGGLDHSDIDFGLTAGRTGKVTVGCTFTTA